MNKREEFKKKLAIVGTTAVVALGGFGIKDSMDKSDLSKYAVDDEKYIDYIDKDENEKLERLENLDSNISRYEELNEKNKLTKEEKEELEQITYSLEREMKSGYLERFYLHDVLKEKIKSVYGVDKVETKWNGKDEINIKLFDKYGSYKAMENKDKVSPILTAMNDIATLQGYEEREKFSKSEIENFIKIQKNMKGFSNIEFIKVDGKPLAYTEPQKFEEMEK